MIPYIFAQIIGVFLVFVGAAALLRYKVYHKLVHRITKRATALIGVATVELLIGLVIVMSHNTWQGPLWQVCITAIGWILVLEALVYLFLPHAWVKRFVRACNTKEWYIIGGILSIGLGFYLAFSGFGLTVLG